MLTACEHCGHNVARNAKACPNCGGATRAGQAARAMKVLVFIGLAIAGLLAWQNHQAERRAAEAARSYQEAIDASNRFLDSQRP